VRHGLSWHCEAQPVPRVLARPVLAAVAGFAPDEISEPPPWLRAASAGRL